MSMDAVFRALADTSRRQLLDRLHARNGQTLNEMCEGLDMTRQAATKHLAILEEANLVATLKRGARSCTFSIPFPSTKSPSVGSASMSATGCEHWPSSRTTWKEKPMINDRFVYVTYIRTTPEKLWQALTEPAFTRQ